MRPSLAFLVGALLPACSFDSSGVADDVAGDDDPGPGDEPDAATPPDAVCGGGDVGFDVANLGACAIPMSAEPLVFPAGVVGIDTTTGTIDAGGSAVAADVLVATQLDGATPVMVIAGLDITIPEGTTLVVTGSRPLALVAYGTLTVDGTIDASAELVRGGPGAGIGCADGAGVDGTTMVATNSLPGGTGGGGGAYSTDGGAGAYVSPVPVAAPTTPGGEQRTDQALIPLRGGCSGGRGGVADSNQARADSGAGGGAIELVAGTSITIRGIVSTSGGGGAGATEPGGGGAGGGAGGAILIHSPSLVLGGAILSSNGGAGGEGRRDTAPGMPGADGAIDSASPATGGSGAAGGNGGPGAVGTADGGDGDAGVGSANDTAGGGGGGGGAGRIHVRTREAVVVEGDALITPQHTSASL